MTPNPTVIKQSEESEEDRSFWKVLILTALGAGSLFLSFFLFDKFLIEGNLVRALGSALFAVIFLSFFVLQVFFTKSRVRIVILSFVQAFAPILFFTDRLYPDPSIILIIAFAILFLFFTGAAVRGERDITNSVAIKFFPVARKVVSRATAGILIAFSIQLYLTYFVWGGFNEDFSRRLVNQTLATSEPIIKTVLTEVSFSDTVDDFFRTLAENELSKIRVGGVGNGEGEAEAAIEFRRLPPAEQEKILGEISLALQKQAEEILGPLNADRAINGEVFRVIKDYVDGIPPATKSVLSLIVAVFFFLAVKGVTFLLYWLPEFIAFLMFKLFMVTGFAYVNLESRSREFIMLS